MTEGEFDAALDAALAVANGSATAAARHAAASEPYGTGRAHRAGDSYGVPGLYDAHGLFDAHGPGGARGDSADGAHGPGGARGPGPASAPDLDPVSGAGGVPSAGGTPSAGPAIDSSSRSGPATPAPGPAPAIPWHTARDIARRAAPGPLPAETAPLGESLGRPLAAPLGALTDLPPFDTSAMDGWAVSGPGPWDLAPAGGATGPHPGILAGHAAAGPLPDGHAIAIATGARVPAGATAVLRSEHGEVRERSGGRTRLYALRTVSPGQDIRPRGQECRRGDQLLPSGAVVTPAVLGLAAAAGYDELTTCPRPQVEVLVLGDELLRHGRPHGGRIRDALGPMLGPWLHELGADAAPSRHLADDPDTLYEAIASSRADVVLTTGGTAAGPVDHVHPTLRRLGSEVLVDGVEVRPGHPMLLARITPHRHLVGLPGNPLAAVSGLLTLAEPLLRTLSARRAPATYRAPLWSSAHGHPRDTRLVPVTYRDDERYGLMAEPLHFHGPAMLRGIAAADAVAVVPPGGGDRGTEVEVLELPWSAEWSPAATTAPYGPAGGTE
ncbi:molybdopterin molybdotransferase MoeA [Streptomyces sp. NPDC048638]|uniref:molybdopterin molybdotransferase MoeA n=1 Tax=Streptomyces sp. NPDC048638 TaxID=3365580 RepID=UPI003716EF31